MKKNNLLARRLIHTHTRWENKRESFSFFFSRKKPDRERQERTRLSRKINNITYYRTVDAVCCVNRTDKDNQKMCVRDISIPTRT